MVYSASKRICLNEEMFFSCRLSLGKRQETKFSHTEWGTWVMDVSCTLSHVIQFFFPSRTVLSVVDSDSVIVVILIEMSKSAMPLSCGREMAFSV